MHDCQLDILGLSETRLSKDTHESEVSIERYNTYRHDRNGSGGGVAVCIQDTLSHLKRRTSMTRIHKLWILKKSPNMLEVTS